MKILLFGLVCSDVGLYINWKGQSAVICNVIFNLDSASHLNES